jgi:uncharacterized protein HemX
VSSLRVWTRLLSTGYQTLVIAIVIVVALGASVYTIDRVSWRIERKLDEVSKLTHQNQAAILGEQKAAEKRIQGINPEVQEALTLLRAIRTAQQQEPSRVEIIRLLQQAEAGRPGRPGPAGQNGAAGHDGLSAPSGIGGCTEPLVSILTAC